jgi:hypothetical protein
MRDGLLPLGAAMDVDVDVLAEAVVVCALRLATPKLTAQAASINRLILRLGR